MPRTDLTRLHGGLALLLALGATLALAVGLAIDPVVAWLVAISAVTFGAYGFDKGRAVRRGLRVPERVLLGLGFLGGTPGALLGMRVFRHKTVKTSFRVRFLLLTVAQAALLAAYLWFLRGKL